MNAILLGAASLGALIACLTHDPAIGAPAHQEPTRPQPISQGTASRETGSIDDARAAADDADVARLMEAAPDEGSMQDVTILDPKTGEETIVQTLSFKG